MLRIPYALFGVALFSLAISTGAALADTDHPVNAAGKIICGTDWMNRGDEGQLLANTARLNPALYQRMIERASMKTSSRMMKTTSGGTEFQFYVVNRQTNAYDVITASLYYEGTDCRIWVDIQDTNTKGNRVTQARVNQLADGLDVKTPSSSRNPAKSIVQNDIEVFGSLPHPSGAFDNKTEFLLTDIKDNNPPGSFVAGFFSPNDQSNSLSSNKLNMLYIDDKEGLQAGNLEVLNTMAHEFQHLIHYNTNRNSEVFPNEGCSEVASILCGYYSTSNSDYMNNTNVPLMRWAAYAGGTSAEILADYARTMTTHHYLREQYGDAFLHNFTSTLSTGLTRYDDALKATGFNTDWKYMLKGFDVANYLQTATAPDPRFRYKFGLGIAAKATATYTGATYPATNSVSLVDYSCRYYAFNTPGGIKFTFTCPSAATVMAILYRGSAVSEVRELNVDGTTEYQLGDSRAFDKIVLVVISLNGGSSTVTWTATSVALGVDDRSATTSGISLVSVPNPVATVSTLNFTVPTSDAVSLKIYDEQGKLVGTVIDGVRYEAGAHQVRFNVEGLSSGHYVAQLTQGGNRTAQSIIVVR